MNKAITTGAKVLAGVGALNWGLQKFVNIDVLSYVPAGIFNTVVVALIAVSGGVLLYWVMKKKV